MVDYDMVHFPPSQVASAAYALTLKVFSCGDWVRSWGFLYNIIKLAIYLLPLSDIPFWPFTDTYSSALYGLHRRYAGSCDATHCQKCCEGQ